MRRLFATVIFIQLSTFSFGQNVNIKSMVDSLQFMKNDTIDCRADLFWRIVAQGKEAIPFLIDKLTDTTATTVNFPCKKLPLNVGEVSYFALEQIAYFPAFLVTHIQFDVITIDQAGNSCWSFFDYLFYNPNKREYQKSVKEWYDKEQINYRKVIVSKDKQTSCQKQFGINTYYKWKE